MVLIYYLKNKNLIKSYCQAGGIHNVTACEFCLGTSSIDESLSENKIPPYSLPGQRGKEEMRGNHCVINTNHSTLHKEINVYEKQEIFPATAGKISHAAGGHLRGARIPTGLEEGQQEQREGMILHSNDKWLQEPPGITPSYSLFEVCSLIYEVLSLR